MEEQTKSSTEASVKSSSKKKNKGGFKRVRKSKQKSSKMSEQRSETSKQTSSKLSEQRSETSKQTSKMSEQKTVTKESKGKECEGNIASCLSERNDPLYLDVFSKLSLQGLVPYSADNAFAVTTESFIPLVERIYDILSSTNKHFACHVSQSMFVHYCVEHLYARCIFIKVYNGDLDIQEKQFFDELSSDLYLLPVPVCDFLRSLGNVKDPRGVHYKLKFPAWPKNYLGNNSLVGSFGQVSSGNHWMYESMPAPLVTAMRIQEDLAYTINPLHDRIWNLPQKLRPYPYEVNKFHDDDYGGESTQSLIHPGFPTKNLLGWSPATTLTVEQRILLEEVGVTPNDFGAVNHQFQHNPRFFEIVAGHIRQAQTVMQMEKLINKMDKGSLSQIAFVERDSNTREKFTRTIPYCEYEIRAASPFYMDSRLSLASIICSFRVKKKAVGKIHSYVCYDWHNYEEIPAEWVESSNYVFDFAQAHVWNDAELFTSFTCRDKYRSEWLQEYLLSNNELIRA